MRMLGASGVFELFVPGISAGALYKYRILGPRGEVRLKADPFAGRHGAAAEHGVARGGVILPVGRWPVDGGAA